ncbi:hypothetical protein TTHERM_001170539 (macronuclear) [Tetrahymena thermophila SB210]|uniref:Uncharacterized protein n=1 Tax=Tetrahymena thermophila (strain SB210) TaxID=312017 RepID=W7XAW5_TETTS|nr:hypothetical protein TTHERM_001170539 [Tetrahymena thermophila SB210]EWS76525.1 hypothetical protein TTHERM_001170539 [Tetrahymena thermophila SB210]|eukprot:XP_012650935.1 hypothetical protein TTHERM_001170539 [Tetrahymena thermophila SB210]
MKMKEGIKLSKSTISTGAQLLWFYKNKPIEDLSLHFRRYLLLRQYLQDLEC